MSVHKHWLADNPAELDHPTIVINYEWEVSRWQADGWAMRGPFVHADQLQGAVEALAALAEFVEAGERDDERQRALIRRARRHVAPSPTTRGQSRETNLPKGTNP